MIRRGRETNPPMVGIGHLGRLSAHRRRVENTEAGNQRLRQAPQGLSEIRNL
jgi:hypothetical protein